MTTHEKSISACVWSSPEPRRLRDTLCLDIGPRVPGTPGMLAGQDGLADALRRAGAVNVSREDVSLPSWREGAASFEVASPRRLRYGCVQHVNSAASDVTAPVFRLP